MHTRPILDWQHYGVNDLEKIIARSGRFDANGLAQVDTLGKTSPVIGGSFSGSASLAGTWYTGDNFPAQYKNTYFHLDYASGWIQQFDLRCF